MPPIKVSKTKTEKVRGAKAHTRYYNGAGILVPSVTTIIDDYMPKPHLVAWANRLGQQGIDSTRYVDALATVGSLAHYLIECHIAKVEPELVDYTPNEVKMATWSLNKYLDWAASVGFAPLLSERRFVDERYQFGGTIDAYGDLITARGSIRALVDFKTSKAIYEAHKLQAGGGYALLLVGAGLPVEQVWILQIGRDETEGFSTKLVTDIARQQRKFLLMRELYALDNPPKQLSEAA